MVSTGDDAGPVSLIHVNGPPGVGKSSLARRYLLDHPLALLVEVDALRMTLGRWEEHEESKLMARDLALALVDAHLRSGHDVIVPQYLGRLDFIQALEDAARRSGATFVEIMLVADEPLVVERFVSRRRGLVAQGGAHPETDVGDDAVGATVAEAVVRLQAVAAERRRARTVTASGDLEETYRALVAAIADG